MKTIELVEAISNGNAIYFRGDTASSVWLTVPRLFVVELNRTLVTKAVKKGWLKRADDGRYFVTAKGYRKLQKARGRKKDSR